MACGYYLPHRLNRGHSSYYSSWHVLVRAAGCVTVAIVPQLILTEKQDVVSRATDDEPTKKKVSKKKLARQKRENRD